MGTAAAELHQMASLGRLLAGIVHEINTPVGSICSNNQVLLRSLDKLPALLAEAKPESLEQARKIAEACQVLVSVDKIACERIVSLVRGLKTFARVDDATPRLVNFNQLLRDTLKLTAAEFGKRIAVETDFGEVPEVEAYPQMLSQVFLNLLVNAGQAIEGEGKIAVRTNLEGDKVHLAIADNGVGMTLEQQAKAFDAGYTTKPVGEGTGLGLPISKDIIEQHGGTIGFESRPGAGCTFHIRIPVRQTRSSS
jgi:two-component system NtrC family sensor kinase